MLIANIDIKNPVLLAPMAGFTDLPFRLICKTKGAGIVYTEFVSSEGLIRSSKKTCEYLIFDEKERPIGMQIFGHNPRSMADSVKFIEDKYHPDIIDLNFGCSVRKVIKQNAGSALLKDLPLMVEIARAVVSSVQTPVTAKIRAGWDRQHIVAVTAAKMLENEGIKALTIHPRTTVDGYKLPADWNIISQVKSVLKIPVIGNGDVRTAADGIRMFSQTGCDAVMIGRGALADPWIFQKIEKYRQRGDCTLSVSPLEKLELCQYHLSLEIEMRGEDQANTVMRKFYRWYFREIPNASLIREKLVLSPNIVTTNAILSELRENLADTRN